MSSNGFFLQAIKHPLSIGAIAPSSQSLSKLMLSHADLASANGVVELGPGTGVFTREILGQLDNDVPFIAIEQNEKFVSLLDQKFPGGQIKLGSAEQLSELLALHGISNINRIISGLPWVAFPTDLQDKILAELCKNLPDDGMFLTYAYFPFNLSPKGRKFHSKLNQHFGDVVKTELVLNVPPALAYVCSQPKRTIPDS